MLKIVYNSNGNTLGSFDGEYIFDGEKNIYRVDGDEVYCAITHAYLGHLKRNQAFSPEGKVIFQWQE